MSIDSNHTTRLSTDSLVHALRMRPDLVLDFFVTFARFEYALVAVGFVTDRRGVAEADWGCFLTFVEYLDRADMEPGIQAGHRLLTKPPKKLVLDGQIARFREVRRTGQTDIRFLLEGVKRGRNNLFHGGKFLTGPQPVDRNETVVTDSLRVLRAVLEAPGMARLRQAYDEPPP